MVKMELRKIRSQVLSLEEIRDLVSDLNLSRILTGNFVGFFRLLRRVPSSFNRLAMLSQVATIRISALKTISIAYRSPPIKIPLETIREWLGFDVVEDVQNCVKSLGVDLDDEVLEPFKLALYVKWEEVDKWKPCWIKMNEMVHPEDVDEELVDENSEQ